MNNAATAAVTLTNATVVDVIRGDDSWMASWGPHPFTALPKGVDPYRCCMCGHKLMTAVVVKADEGTFILGQDCMTSVGKLKGAVTRAVKLAAARQAKIARVVEMRAEVTRFLGDVNVQSFCLTQPHPAASHAAKGKSYLDYVSYWLNLEVTDGKSSDYAAAGLSRVATTLRGLTVEAQEARKVAKAEADKKLKAAQDNLKIYAGILADYSNKVIEATPAGGVELAELTALRDMFAARVEECCTDVRCAKYAVESA